MSNITDEFVTKKQVLDALENLPWCIEDDFFSAIDRAARAISSIPGTPSPQDRRASWVKATGMMPPEFHGKHRCSLCGGFALSFKIGHEELSAYCPYCGAEMGNSDSSTARYFHNLQKIADAVVRFRDKHNIFCPESLWQMDNPLIDAPYLVDELIELVGYKEYQDEL